ncbi:MAG: histidine kinase [Bacteroidetes bacterium]|nr:histidine kinase [Bacteroidota bacterium]
MARANIISLALIWLQPFLAHVLMAQEINFRRLSVSEGLTQSSVLALAQDEVGYLWVGTADGLNRYDGYDFIHFRNRPGDPHSIADNFIFCLEPSSGGNLWIGTLGGGLSYYRSDQHAFENFQNTGSEHQISHNDVYAVLEHDSFLLVGTYLGLDISYDRKSFSSIEFDDASYSKVNDIAITGKGDVLVAHDYGLAIWNRKTNELTPLPTTEEYFALNNASAYAICALPEGTWVGTDMGAVFLDISLKKIRVVEHDEIGEAGKPITAICQTNDGTLWLGSNGGGLAVLSANDKTFRRFANHPSDEYSLSDNVVTSIVQDRSGVVWIGTYHGGISKYDRYISQFRLYRPQAEFRAAKGTERVFALAENAEGDVWVGTDGGGLCLVGHQFDGQGKILGHTYRHFDELSHLEKIWALAPDQHGNIWIGSLGHGLARYNPRTGVVKSYKKDSTGGGKLLSDNSVYALKFDGQGRLWIGTDVGINCLDTATGNFIWYNINPEENRTFSSNTVLAIEMVGPDEVWAGSFGGGIAVIQPSTGSITHLAHSPNDTSSLSYDKVMSIYKDHKGRVWVGTFGGGFNLYNQEKQIFTAFTELDGLANDVVYGFVEDREGLIWMSTNFGLSAFNPETHRFKNYDQSCNLQSNEFNQGAYCRGAHTGRIYFGGIKGFNSFHPDEMSINAYAPPVHISAYYHPGEPVGPLGFADKDLIQLQYTNNAIFFEFVAFSYVNSHLNKFRYLLEGFNSDWVDLGFGRSAAFTNLPPGKYTFRVQACNNDGVWNTTGDAVQLQIMAPVYLKWWFQPMLFVLALLMVAGVSFMVVKTVRNSAKRQLVEAELKLARAEGESIKHQLSSLRAQMDPHFIFNSLNSIQHFIENNDKGAARHYLSKFATLMRAILNSTRLEYIALSDELDTLKLYIDLERLRFNESFDFQIEIGESIDAEDIEIPTMMLQPYVENAIIHGIKNKPGGMGKLHIGVARTSGGIQISIEDNGVGRQRAAEIKALKTNKYQSLGMKVTQDRIGLMAAAKGRYTVEVSDVPCADGTVGGTRVLIAIADYIEE